MYKFNSKFKIGTRVKIAGFDDFFTIKEINEDRTLVKLSGVEGSFQRYHILTFTNKI